MSQPRWTAAVAVSALLATSSAFADGTDGSATDNPALLGVPPATVCDCTPTEPEVEGKLDWSVGLRGAIIDNSHSGASYEGIVAPSFSFNRPTLRGSYGFGGSAEISSNGDALRIDSLELNGSIEHALDEDSVLAASGSLTASQEASTATDLHGTTAVAPVVISGQGQGSFTRRLGLLELTARGEAGRIDNSDSTLTDGTTQDNSASNVTFAGIGGRIGTRISPALLAYLDGDVRDEVYDAVAPTLLLKLDNLTYQVVAGLTGQWNDTFTFDISGGIAHRVFADPSLDAVDAWIADASMSFTPNDEVSITGSLTTTLGAPDISSTGTVKIEHTASIEGAYRINSWLRLRASAGASFAETVGTDAEEFDWHVGAGADYLVNDHTDLTADYLFTRSEAKPDPAEAEHRLTLGVTFHR